MSYKVMNPKTKYKACDLLFKLYLRLCQEQARLLRCKHDTTAIDNQLRALDAAHRRIFRS